MFLDNTPGRTCFINQKEYLFFSGYSYLGMNHVEEFTHTIKEGIDRYGILFPSSRNSNTRLQLFEKAEDYLSILTSRQESVLFSSGYLAGQTIADILSRYANIYIAPGTHPAICVPGRHVSTESFSEWTQNILEEINRHKDHAVIIADSINIMEGIVNDFSFVKQIAPGIRIIFLVDDSHGIGILGDNGEGIISRLPHHDNIDYFISYSLSKAFGIPGGGISASAEICNLLRAHPNYTGSTSMSPAHVHAFTESRKLYLKQKKKLEQNIMRFASAIHRPGPLSPLPVFVCDKEDAGELFFRKGVVISSFSYPYPSSHLVNRFIMNALHTDSDIDKLARIVEEIN